MKIEVFKGKISINISELFELCDLESKIQIAEDLACNDEIVKYVAQQILDGWTENGNSSGYSVTASPNPVFGLDWARREISKRSAEIAEEEIQKLEEALRFERETVQRLYIELYQKNKD